MTSFKQYLLEASSFTSDSPSTGGSRGIQFKVEKNKDKSVGEHENGQPKEHHDIYHDGRHIGSVSSYSGYQDKKAAGSRIVSSRKLVRHWVAIVHGSEHNRHGGPWDRTPENAMYSETGFKSKKDALQHVADAHKSNQNRK